MDRDAVARLRQAAVLKIGIDNNLRFETDIDPPCPPHRSPAFVEKRVPGHGIIDSVDRLDRPGA